MGLTSNSTGLNLLDEELLDLQHNCDFTIAFAGNPNVGKSTIFNSLTGLHQHTGNWPGKTVTNASGICSYKNKSFLLIDLPGTYSLMSNSQEEEIARDYICLGNPDATVIVVDATCLERNLNLVFQIMEKTPNVIVCVNLMDEAKKKNIDINLKELEKQLGVPVIGTTAHDKRTLNNLTDCIYEVCIKNRKCNPHLITYEYHDKNSVISAIMKRAEEISNKVCSFNDKNYNIKNKKIDKILTSKKFGIPIMLAFLCVIFWITIIGANYPSAILTNFFNYLQDKLLYIFNVLHIPTFITELLINGMYKTVAWVIAVMLPPMAIFFPLFTFLEDIGYLPRIAFNLDNYFKKSCTTGKQALTMCMGFGCNAAGIVGSKIIDSPREKLISMLTNAFVPCNGRFPLLITISTIFIGSYFNRIYFFNYFNYMCIIYCSFRNIFNFINIKNTFKNNIKGHSIFLYSRTTTL